MQEQGSQNGKSNDEYNCNNELMNSEEFKRIVDDGKSHDKYNYKDDQSGNCKSQEQTYY